MIQKFENTATWNELQSAEQVLTEVPFSLPINKEASLYHLIKDQVASGDTILLTGIIDLVYKIDGKWKIVDFKTDRPKDADDVLPVLTKFYQNQVEIYKQVWETVSKEKVDEAQLYFVSPDKLVTV
jgi:ATP-dependent helicase/nuclease subunit A